MRKIQRYINGIVIGMCGEYLLRVQFSIWPVIIIVALIIGMLIDIFYE